MPFDLTDAAPISSLPLSYSPRGYQKSSDTLQCSCDKLGMLNLSWFYIILDIASGLSVILTMKSAKEASSPELPPGYVLYIPRTYKFSRYLLAGLSLLMLLIELKDVTILSTEKLRKKFEKWLGYYVVGLLQVSWSVIGMFLLSEAHWMVLLFSGLQLLAGFVSLAINTGLHMKLRKQFAEHLNIYIYGRRDRKKTGLDEVFIKTGGKEYKFVSEQPDYYRHENLACKHKSCIPDQEELDMFEYAVEHELMDVDDLKLKRDMVKQYYQPIHPFQKEV